MKLSIEKLKDLIEDSSLDHRGKNIIGKCPKCKQGEFGISIENNHLFGCYRLKSCGFRGNIFTLLKYLGKLDEYISTEDVYERKEEKLQNKLKVSGSEINLELETIMKPIGWRRIQFHPYLEKRGFTEYNKYKVGTTLLDPKLRDNYLIFLIEERDEIKAWIARHLWDKERILQENQKYKDLGLNKKILRYRNSETDFSKLLLGYEELTPNTTTVVLVEGIFDKFNIDKLLELHSQEAVKCLCTFKCDCSLEQIFKIQQFSSIKNIILLYDPDVVNQTKRVGIELENRFQNVKVGYSANNKDPGEMTLEDIDNVLSTLKSPQDFFVNKLQVKKLL